MELIEIIQSGDIQALNREISINPDVVNTMINNNTALHVAISSRNPVMISFLIENGADIKGKNNLGMTPLQRLIGVNMDDLATEVLAVSDLNHQDKMGYTALGYAIEKRNTDMVVKLIENGADVNKGFRIFTPLTLAIKNNDVEISKALIENGADVNQRDPEGNLPKEISKNPKITLLLQSHEIQNDNPVSKSKESVYSL